jgi:hypothetical protein
MRFALGAAEAVCAVRPEDLPVFFKGQLGRHTVSS